MNAENKVLETGSNPYYLNINNTAKDFSDADITNQDATLLDTLSKFVIIEEPEVTPASIQQEYIIEEAKQPQ